MRGLRTDSKGVFYLSLVFYIISRIYQLDEALLMLEPFMIINLAHYGWYKNASKGRYSDSLGVLQLFFWIFQIFWLLAYYDLAKIFCILGGVGLLWRELHLRFKIGLKVYFLILVPAATMYILGYWLPILLGSFSILLFSSFRSSQNLSYLLVAITGNCLVLFCSGLRTFQVGAEHPYDSLLIVLGYTLGHWLLVEGGRWYESGKIADSPLFPWLSPILKLR